MNFQEMLPISREDAERAFAAEDPEAICSALVRSAFHDPDRLWIEQRCFQFAHHPHMEIRQVAAICLGHLARIHGALSLDIALPILRELLKDPEVAGTASDAIDDITVFIPNKRRKRRR